MPAIGDIISISFPSAALLKREFVSLLRKSWVFVLLLLYLSIIGVVDILMWPDNNFFLPISRAQQLVYGMTAVLSILVGLVMPGLAATSITSEKESGTFEQLHMTLITPRGIVYAKMLNAVALLMAIGVVSLPFFGVVLFMGGVDYTEIIAIYASLTTMTIFCAAWGVLSSAIFKTSTRAIVGCYVLIFLWSFGAPMMLGIFSIFGTLTDSYVATEIVRLIGSILEPPIISITRNRSGGYLIAGIVAQLGYTVVLAELAASRLKRGPDEIAAPSSPIPQTAPAVAATPQSKGAVVARIASAPDLKKTYAKGPIAPPPQLSAYNQPGRNFMYKKWTMRGAINDKVNPVMAKEVLFTTGSKWTSPILGFFVCLFIFMVVLSSKPESCAVFVILMAPAMTATAISREYDRGDMDMLRMTLLTPRKIVMGKLWAAAVSMAPAGLALILPLIYASIRSLSFSDYYYYDQTVLAHLRATAGYLLFIPITIVTCVAASLALGMLASILRRTSGRTTVLSYLMNLFLYFGLPLGVLLTITIKDYFIPHNRSGQDAFDYFKLFSPYASCIDMFHNSRHIFYNIISYSFSHALFWALTVGFVWLSIVIFDIKHMRDS